MLIKKLGALLLILTFAFSLCTQACAEKNTAIREIVVGGSAIGIRDSSKQDSEITFNIALGELLKSHGANFSVKIFDSSQDLLRAFDNNQLDGIFGTPLEFLQRESQMHSTLVALHYKNSPLAQPLLMLVRTDDKLKSIKELRGKRYSLTRAQDIEMLYLNTTLLENQEPEADAFFGERLISKNTNTSLMDVFFGKSDFTIVRESEYKTALELNPQLGKKLCILNQSAPFIFFVGGAKKTMAANDRELAFQSFNELSSTEKGQQLMRIIHAESIETVSIKDLDNVKELITHYQTLKAKLNGQSKILKLKKQISN